MNTFNGTAVQQVLSRVTGCALRVMFIALLGLFSLLANAQNGESDGSRRNPTRAGSFNLEGVSVWFRKKFSESELESYRPEDFRIESHFCNCSDRPEPHYPYMLVFFSTPKGDLVGRPDRRGFDTVITPLAERRGELYCAIDGEEDQCFGSFANPCQFTDFRYGKQLAPYFPSCKVIDPEPT